MHASIFSLIFINNDHLHSEHKLLQHAHACFSLLLNSQQNGNAVERNCKIKNLQLAFLY